MIKVAMCIWYFEFIKINMNSPAREFGQKCAEGEENEGNIYRKLGKKN